MEDWFESGSDETGSVIQGEDKEPSKRKPMFEDIRLEDEIIANDFTPLNKNIDDESMNKLCPDREKNYYSAEGVHVDYVFHSIFNHAIQWKQ